MSITALLYNWGFFTMLGFAPFPMGLSAIQLGFVFFGWGLLVAFFSVIGAPRLQARFGTARSLYAALGLFAVDLVVMSIWADRVPVLIATVIVSGAFIGINNTLTTQAVMLVSPVERPVASAAYGFVRFLGGGLAPYAAGKLAEHLNLHAPFAVGAVAVLAAVLVLSTGHRMLAQADAGLDEDGHSAAEHGDVDDVAGEVADEFGGAPAAIDSELQAETSARRSASVRH
jgi:ACDE family multidrug resistance protein